MFRCLSVLAGAAALAGCVSVLPEPDAPGALYRFGPMPATHQLSAVISIREPDAPRLFGGRAIASQAPDGSLRLVPGVEWADRATRMFQLSLLDTLDSSAGGAAISASEARAGDYVLSWRISDFSLTGDTARCQLELTLIPEMPDGVVAQTGVTNTATASGRSASARAQAMAEAGRGCVREAADFVAAATS